MKGTTNQPVIVVDFTDEIGVFMFKDKNTRQNWYEGCEEMLSKLYHAFGTITKDNTIDLDGGCCDKGYCMANILNNSKKEHNFMEITKKLKSSK